MNETSDFIADPYPRIPRGSGWLKEDSDMAKVIEGNFGAQVKAEPWCEGKILAGAFRSADALPNVDSRKINFETSPGAYAAVWETASLAPKVAKMTPGAVYRILCLGKALQTRNGVAWDFTVEEAENAAESAAWAQEYAAYVAGGGK